VLASVEAEAIPPGSRALRAGAAPALVAGSVFALARASGGWAPASWGWAATAFALVALAQVLTTRIAVSKGEAAFAALLGAVVAWTAASAAWSASAPLSLREAERATVYAAAVVSLVLIAGRTTAGIAGALLAAIAAVSGSALVERLLGVASVAYDHRLDGMLTYSNGLGLLAAVGILLGLAVALSAAHPAARAAAGATLVVDAATLYFTFSRGSWLALGAGLVAGAAASRQFARTATLALVPATAVALCARSRGLAVGDADRRTLALLALLAMLSAALASARLELRVHRLAGALAVAALAAGLAVAVARGVPERLTSTFAEHTPSAAAGTRRPVADPRTRLFDAHVGRLVLWRAAVDDFRAHPLIGAGAGTFERYWNRHRTQPVAVRDAHSLYLETLAELGPPGFALVVAALALPLVIGIRRRRTPWVPFVLGAYVAYLVHTGIDWDWELPAVTLAGLFAGVALLATPAARPRAPCRGPAPR
jgi:O-Antigen ligase